MTKPERRPVAPNKPIAALNNDHVWKDRQLANRFLDGVRGGIPFAAEQIDLLLRVIEASGTEVNRFLDLGCGDGALGRAILDRFPNSSGRFLDFSAPMLEAAEAKLANYSGRFEIASADFGNPDWKQIFPSQRFDLILSGFAIHHQPDERKRALYQELHDLLLPQGLFLNLEHVASKSQWGNSAFDELMIDSLWYFHGQRSAATTRESVAEQYVHRPDKVANILATVETQCDWLREIGFVDVDCFFKVFELALFGGMKKTDQSS